MTNLRHHIQEILNNPVANLMEARLSLVKRLAWLGILLPLITVILLMSVCSFYEKTAFSIMPFSQVTFLAVSTLFVVLSFALSLTTIGDPLLKSVKEDTADQVILAGITPGTWMVGHIVYSLRSWLTLSLLFMPALYSCKLLGGVTWYQPIWLCMISLVIAVTVPLILLTLIRNTFFGILILALYAFGIILSLISFDLPMGHPRYQLDLPFAVARHLSPITLFITSFNTDDNYFFNILSFSQRNGSSAIAQVLGYLTANGCLCIMMVFAILAGQPLLLGGDLNVREKFLNNKSRKKTNSLLPPLQTESNRSFDLLTTLELFQQNRTLANVRVVEPLFKLMTTILVCVIFYLFAESVLSISTSTKDVSISLFPAVTIAIIFANSFLLLFDRRTFQTKPYLRPLRWYLQNHILNWLLRMAFIIIWSAAFYRSCALYQNSGSHLLYIESLLMLLFLTLAIYTSLRDVENDIVSVSYLLHISVTLLVAFILCSLITVTIFDLRSITQSFVESAERSWEGSLLALAESESTGMITNSFWLFFWIMILLESAVLVYQLVHRKTSKPERLRDKEETT